ncbi:unnamed protein product [Didymodactylos carnosus]|uniref:Serpin domain-containing protein n=2 Tax=Didymodactylos carnosus TaxID=1234261 RepID=A0A8S2F4K5_9BILA|nr:unnamed protein product [Didymodactylos carnosus]CAF4187922.1 unnamed protein product [Didymodactylos carnosus]
MNVIISPASVAFALSSAAAGANGTTLQQILLLIDEKSTIDQLLNPTREQTHLLKSSNSEHIKLKLANRIYVNHNFKINETYVNRLREYIDSDIISVDFEQNASGTVQELNLWIKQKTKYLINELLKPNDIKPGYTQLIFINCIYFKGDWKYSFDTSKTEHNYLFYVDDGTIITNVTLMYQDRVFFKYLDASPELDAQIVHIPYKNNNFSDSGGEFLFTIILPNRGIKLSNVQNKLNYYRILKQIFDYDNQQEAELRLYLPKFRIEYEFLTVKETLKEMGMTDAFDGRADFSGITNGGLAIDDVKHKSVINVDETGSEAAATTALLYGRGGFLPHEQPIEFKCDRPFLFLIHEKESGLVLFAGKYQKPQPLTKSSISVLI